ncbi:helix-turn-helix domain-containing protein [Marinobacter lacisalsi]|uniref:Helix-turn-helix domain-containing protein n=1 Tax=Marinobacter lacisalsi TaxID=475979 RepID=A0ABV8QC09_9GAMM
MPDPNDRYSAMREANSVASVSSEHYLTSLKGLGHIVEPDVLKRAQGQVPPLPMCASSVRVPLECLQELQGGLMDRYADPLLMIRAYSHLNYEPGFMARTFLAGALSLGDAISLLCRYMTVSSDLCRIRLREASGIASLQIEPNPGYVDAWELVDATVYSLTRILLGLGVPQIDVIRLNHVPTMTIQQQYRALLPARVAFGNHQTAIDFPVGALSRPLHWHPISPEKLAKRERRLNRLQPQPRWQESVDVLLPLLSRLGEANIDRCAHLLAVSRRSLQRHIRAEGYTFRDLVDRNHRQLSANYLARGYSNDQTASLLGYRQPAQFYRAFRGWYGCSPSEYRQRSPIHPCH